MDNIDGGAKSVSFGGRFLINNIIVTSMEQPRVVQKKFI
jgi:hypothetical protein